MMLFLQEVDLITVWKEEELFIVLMEPMAKYYGKNSFAGILNQNNPSETFVLQGKDGFGNLFNRLVDLLNQGNADNNFFTD